MQIRTAQSSDLDQVLMLSQQGFDYDEQFDPTLNMQWSQSNEARVYFGAKIDSEDALLIVAVRDSEIVGYLAAGCKTSEPYRQPSRLAELEVMFVAETFRNKGVGRQLTNEFFRWATGKGCQRAKVVASAGNIRAAKFYRDNGFQDYTVALEKEI
ncbi:MAG: GNAT family N-acetyltransferase [Deltaproteobacteria bacterium]|nr:GNAT family N-acetyltransferase [Deltaproteobacteria bacterium]